MSNDVDRANAIINVAAANGLTVMGVCHEMFRGRRNHPVLTEGECRDIAMSCAFPQSEIWEAFRPCPGQEDD